MKYCLFFSVFVFSSFSFCQLTGTWKGLLMKNGQKIEQAQIIWFEFKSDGDFIAQSREEITGKEQYNLRKLKGKVNVNHFEGLQTTVVSKKDGSGIKWCDLNFTGDFIDSTGYLQGTFLSKVCKGNVGKFVCFKVDEKVPTGIQKVELQSWRPIFVDDIKNGRKSREIRLAERANFKFTPIFFDYDKAEVKTEYLPFVEDMVRVVLSHTDLRIKVVGHTDSDGSDLYNVDLSQRRAQAIIDCFVAKGLARDKIEIDFKGESEPVSDNKSAEGRQQNRRVDFSFIGG
jgi:OmpA-OmpF porin, OOP family